MKRIGYVFDEVISLENLRSAHFEAKKSRRPKRRFKAIVYEMNLERNLQKLHAELEAGTWRMHPYSEMMRRERGKLRDIFYSKFHEDSIVQHAITRTVGKRLNKTLIRDTFASIKGRGTHDGLKRLRDYVFSLPPDVRCYVYKSDIRKCYQSIKHEPLKARLTDQIKDRRMLRLFEVIIDSHEPGIPIGNPISPLFANVLLSELDHTAKEMFRIKGYFRNLDDIVAIRTGDDCKERLKEFALYVKSYLAQLGLEIKPNEQVYPIERGGVDFLGYVVQRYFVRLRVKTERRFRRKARKFKENPTAKHLESLSSYWGLVKWLSKGRRLWLSLLPKTIHKLRSKKP